MSSPSAKYDAEGSGGIINIKTRKGFMQGLSGSVTANGGLRLNPTGEGSKVNPYGDISANLMYKTDKTLTSFTYCPQLPMRTNGTGRIILLSSSPRPP